MENLFNKCYGQYFRWNEELLNHFFAKDKSEVLLYVDDLLLEEIGQKIGLNKNYRNEFVNSVENFCINYDYFVEKKLLKKCKDHQYKCNQGDKCKFFDEKRIGCLITDPLIVANNIITHKLVYYKKSFDHRTGNLKILVKDGKALIHNMPFFAIVVYVILMFDNGISQRWENVNTPTLSIGNSSRTYILPIWEAINKLDDRFDANASVFDRPKSDRRDFVGRILFHLPLSISTRNKIWDALYKSSVWKVGGARSFFDIVGLIMPSINNSKANNELKDILKECISSNNYNCIAARKVQSVFDDFNIETYKNSLNERANHNDYKQTLVSGQFALGIYLQDDNEQYSIVLLTTVQHEVNTKDIYISESSYGTLAGYNTSLVEYKGSTSVELKDYTLRNREYNITPLATDDVVFFYKYNDSLFIQTRDIIPSESYVIAVRKEFEEKFELWCKENNNNVYKYSDDSSRELCGADWTIFYTDDRLNGQYYNDLPRTMDRRNSLTAIVMKGGIEKSKGIYFINALPYFEIPEIYDAESINVYMNLNGKIFEGYTKIISNKKLILDIPQMPIYGDEYAYISIGLEYNKTRIFAAEFNICGQLVTFNSDYMYRFDRFGRITIKDSVYSGNYVENDFRLYLDNNGLFPISKNNFTKINSENLYLTNLVAANCFGSENSEISYTQFSKCLCYATTRLNINVLQDDKFEKRVQSMLSKMGIVHFDSERKKCQAIAPSFMRVPLSVYRVKGTQLYLLSGCYTRAFIADLLEFCNDNNVSMFRIEHNYTTDEMKLLPPIILLGHNFKPGEFCSQFGHQCSILTDYDFALSLVNLIPSHKEICSLFKFQKESDDFSKQLEPAKSTQLPRIRVRNSVGNLKVRYIEGEDNNFAEINPGLLTWASLYCHNYHNIPFIGVRNKSIYLPKSLLLPEYIYRALYQMNPGLPTNKKVFIRGRGGNSYFTIMNQYTLHSAERCAILASKIVGDIDCKSNCIKTYQQTKFKIWFWKAKFNGQKYNKSYLVLCEDNDIPLAIACKNSVYINCNGRYQKIVTNSINDTMTFLISQNWKFLNNYASIGYSRDGGVHYESVYEIINEELILPNKSNVEISPVEII